MTIYRSQHHIEWEHLSLDEFLSGPDRYAQWEEGAIKCLYKVRDIYARPVWDILEETPADKKSERNPSASRIREGFQYTHHDEGIILRCPKGRIAGVYLGIDVALHTTFQGYGLGAELIAHRIIKDGGIPVWDLDPPKYTKAGVKAHAAALRMIQELGPEIHVSTKFTGSAYQVAGETCATTNAHA